MIRIWLDFVKNLFWLQIVVYSDNTRADGDFELVLFSKYDELDWIKRALSKNPRTAYHGGTPPTPSDTRPATIMMENLFSLLNVKDMKYDCNVKNLRTL